MTDEYIPESEYGDIVRGEHSKCGGELVRVRRKIYCDWCAEFVPESEVFID